MKFVLKNILKCLTSNYIYIMLFKYQVATKGKVSIQLLTSCASSYYWLVQKINNIYQKIRLPLGKVGREYSTIYRSVLENGQNFVGCLRFPKAKATNSFTPRNFQEGALNGIWGLVQELSFLLVETLLGRKGTIIHQHE